MSNIDGLASEWLEVKAEEKLIIARRHAIEAQITEALEAKSEGSITHKLELFKVTLTQPVSRKVDPILWEKVKDKIPENMRPVKETISADAAGCRYLLEKEPRMWAKILIAFESKPGKVGVKVEAL
jgi:chaperonin cofactor prefoldin